MGTVRRALSVLAGASLVAGVAAVATVGCGSSKPPADADVGVLDASVTPFTEVEMRAATTAYQTKYCAALARCGPLSFAVFHGSMEACIGADAPRASVASVYGHGSTLTPTTLLACANALDLSSCDTFARFVAELVLPVPECRPYLYGTLPEGSPCGRFNQCASGRCSPPLGAPAGACGVCVAQEPVGARCLFFLGCTEGSACQGETTGTTTCKKLGDVGEACDLYSRCHFGLICSGGLCTRPAADDSCDPDIGCVHERNCNPTTRKCETVAIAGAGERCGALVARQFPTYCPPAYTCTRRADADAGAVADPDGGPPPEPIFTCVPKIPEGRACDLAEHPFDNPCIKGICYQNRCQLRGPAQCSAPAVPP